MTTRVVVASVVRYYRYRDIYGHGLSFYFNNLRGSFMNNDLLSWWFFARLLLDWSWSRQNRGGCLLDDCFDPVS